VNPVCFEKRKLLAYHRLGTLVLEPLCKKKYDEVLL